MTLTNFRTLGRSGLIVSPLALGTMTFGTQRWGSSDEVSRAVFDAYVEAGGNFVDTADVYSGGHSEALVGRFTQDRGLRERMVLATKFTFGGQPGNPNAGGNGRKNMRRALDGSLRRLKTDYVDLYWMHAWDGVTPAEEVLHSLSDLVRAGTIRYYGLSNVPAWYATRVATLAESHRLPGPVALQLQYSLVAREIEGEHVPAARALGLGLTPWSPLAGGFLAGKYERQDKGASGEGRLSGANPFGDTKFTEHNWQVLDTVRAVAAEVNRPPAQVALAWVMAQPGVSAPIVGASGPGQLQDHLAALALHLTPGQLQRLEAGSVPGPNHDFTALLKRAVFSGASVEGWR